MRLLLPLLIGTLMWSCAGWSAFPRKLSDLPAFQPARVAATLAADAFGLTRASHPLRDTGPLFLPILGGRTNITVMTGGSASLLPIGLILIAALALPGRFLARVANRLTTARRQLERQQGQPRAPPLPLRGDGGGGRTAI